jgi:NAD(P)H-flavin reductase/ferredoxin
MTARISYDDRLLETKENESVLDCLSRYGIGIPHSCRSGVCQSCLMQLAGGEMKPEAQKALKPTLQKQNLFLACQFKPTADVAVKLPDSAGLDYVATVTGKRMLNHNVLQLFLTTDVPFPCEPGQYLTLINGAGVARSYSIANDPARDRRIELHIRLLNGGLMSEFLRVRVEGDKLTVRGPAGSCFYVPEPESAYPLVLAGTGTGLAPLYGIAAQALRLGHQGPVQLFHGALRDEDLYLVEELQSLGQAYPNFTYEPCVLHGESGRFYRAGNIEEYVLKALAPDRTRTRVFLCGAAELVNTLKRKTFLSGVASKHIFADPFLPSRAAA